MNPWHGAKKPKKIIEVKKADAVPTNDELDRLQKFAFNRIQATGTGSKNKKQGSTKALGAIIILRATGMRSGALTSLDIDSNGSYSAKSKGGLISGRLSEEIINKLAELGLDKNRPFRNYRSFSKWFERATKILGLTFTIHGTRHRFAIDYYKISKDIVGLQRALGHSSILATQAYLATLDI